MSETNPHGSPEEEGYPADYDWTDRATIRMAADNLMRRTDGSIESRQKAITMKTLRAEYYRLRETRVTVNGVEMGLFEAKKAMEEMSS